MHHRAFDQLRLGVRSTLFVRPHKQHQRELRKQNTMLHRALQYAVAVVALYACLQGAFLTFQAHQFLIEPYSRVGFSMLALSTAALAATGILALLGRSGFHALALVVCALAPLLLVAGISHMANTPLLDAFKQAVCSQGVGICFPQAASFLYVLPVLAVATVVSLAVAPGKPTQQSAA